MKNKTIIIGLTVSLLLSTTAGRAAYTPTLEDDSIYEITNVSSAEEADFSLVEIDENGQAAVTYYKYNIKEGAVSHEPLDEDMKGQDITGNFFGQTGGNGAAITNRTDTVFNSWDIGNITGDFVNNSVEGNLFNGPQGGAIYNRPLNGGSTSIGNITGDFIGNSAVSESTWPSYGGAIYNSTNAAAQTATIGDITGNFIGNHASNANTHAYGGAIYNYSYNKNNLATIGVISGSFIGNYAEGKGMALGGAIYTSDNLTLASKGKNIQFSGNYTITDGNRVNNAIFMDTDIADTVLTFDVSGGGHITFLDQIDGGDVNDTGTEINYDKQYSIVLKGNGSGTGKGNIFFADTVNNASSVTADDVNLTFGSYDGHHANFGDKSTSLQLNNSLLSLKYDSYQSLKLNELTVSGNSLFEFGANFNQGLSDSINTEKAEGSIGIFNIRFDDYGNVGDKITIFDNAGLTINNLGSYTKIYNNLTYKFEQQGNQLVIASKSLERPQSIVKKNEILDVQETTLNNAMTGILDNSGITTITDSSFSNNRNDGHGGVIVNRGQLTIQNTDFTNNASEGNGGAIDNAGDLTLIADNDDMTFDGNTDASGSNDIYMRQGTRLDINITNKGTMTFNGGINGENGYLINITGDGSGNLVLNGRVDNAEKLNVADTSLVLKSEAFLDNQFVELTNATLDIANNTIGTVNLKGYRADGAAIRLDVNTAENVSDVLNISGDLTGTTGLILNMLSSVKQTEDIVFANTPDDDDATKGGFVISRMVGNPYEYNISVKYDAVNKQWLFPKEAEPTPIPEPEPQPPVVRPVAPEYVAYGGLPAAAAELTRGLSRIISAKVAAGKIFSNNCCGVYDEAYDGSVLRNVWIDAGYQNANIDKPVDMEADVWGITGGFDIQADAHNKLGVFAAYRRGQYDLSGKGTYYNSTLGSRIDIDSWLGGLYYRFDKNRLYVMSTVFGGIQKADVKTDDGTIKTDTDADQFGGSLETGYVYGLGKTLTLEPSLGISYAHINYGDIHDRAGTTAAYDNLNYFEAEAGIKLEKTFYYDEGTAKVYIRPSVIQTFGDSGDVRIDSLRPTNSLRNQTLGRIELGGRYGFENRLSFYGWTHYTYGSSYDAAAFGIGLNYAW